MRPSTSWALSNGPAIDAGDTTAVLFARIRQLKLEAIDLMAQIRLARIDSVALERHHKIEIDDLNRRLGWAEDQRLRWYQQPAFVAGLTAIITIWATLQAVQIGI